MTDSVTIEGVSKRYSKASDSGGVFEVNATIPAGKFTTLLGESGSGKTTLLRLLAGFLRPDVGTITQDGDVVAGDKKFVPTQDRNLAMVFQSYALWPHLTVYKNVSFGLEANRTPKSEIPTKVRKTLDLVGLGHLENRRPAELSGGQQQRVSLARSLVLEPTLLLLDEPLSNLDADLRQQMRTQLKTLQHKTGITFVYVTHDQEEAFSLSDQIIVLDQGRILQQGSPQDIYSRPTSAKVARLMGRRSLHLPGMVASLTDASIELDLDGGERVSVDRAQAGPQSVESGDRITLMIHPEHLKVSVPEDSRSGASLVGTVQANLFAGREAHLEVLFGGGQSATVFVSTDTSVRYGESIKVWPDLDRAWVYRSDDAPADNATLVGAGERQ